MANTRELRRRIKSIKNTSQITKAMQMVAATKMRKAQNQAINGRPYSESLTQVIVRLLPQMENGAYPLLSSKDSDKVGVILLSTDKGLVGALNTNLIRAVLASNLDGGKVIFYTLGKKGRTFVVKTGQGLEADFENPDTVSFRTAVQLAQLATEAFLSDQVGKVFLIYPHFISILRQEPRTLQILPINLFSISTEWSQLEPEPKLLDFLYEPDIDSILDFTLIHYIQSVIYQSLLETKASEHSARMMAMQNATDNALELVSDLTLAYNQIRQDNITRELLEITSAQAALN